MSKSEVHPSVDARRCSIQLVSYIRFRFTVKCTESYLQQIVCFSHNLHELDNFFVSSCNELAKYFYRGKDGYFRQDR